MISVQLDRQQYVPGELIQGSVTWTQISRGVDFEIRLIWYTLGKGSRDYSIVSSQPISQPAESGKANFSFAAPDWPHSFSGELISLQWAIEVVQLPGEEAVEVELIIAPTGKEIFLPRDAESTTLSQQQSSE